MNDWNLKPYDALVQMMFPFQLGGILRFQPFIFQGFSHLSLESSRWDRGRKKGAVEGSDPRWQRWQEGHFWKIQQFSVLHPGRWTAGTWEYHPIYEGKSSEPNHHGFRFQPLIFQGVRKIQPSLMLAYEKIPIYIYVYIYIYWVGFHPLYNLNNQGFFHCSFVQGSEFWLPCGFFKTTLKVSKVPLLLGNIPNGKNPKMLGNTTSLETGIITPFLWGPQNHHESWSWATALRSRERG